MARTDRMVLLEDGPWSEMIDSTSPTARKEGAYQLGQNVYPQDPAFGDAIVGRPGVRPLGARLGASIWVQGIIQFPHGVVESTVAVAGGELWTFDWPAQAWTKVVTTANLTTAGVTVTTNTLRFGLLVVKDQLLVSDGQHSPFLWDGTAGGGITALTACPPLYGQPTLHQARLFGIKASDPRTMVWSEADDPTTGYEAGGFNNAWTLRQTDPHALARLVGTNQGLIVFRDRSVTMAVGEVGDLSFQATTTHEAIDQTIGTTTPFSVVEVGPNIAFLDADGRPYLLRPGAVGAQPIWQGFRETLQLGAQRINPLWTFGVHYTPANLLCFGIAHTTDVTGPTMLLVLDANTENPHPVAVWTGYVAGNELSMFLSAAAMVLDTSNPSYPVPRLLHGTFQDSGAGAGGGYVYAHGNPDDPTFLSTDTLQWGSSPIAHLVRCQPLGFSTKREKVFDRLDVAVRTDMLLALTAVTPRGASLDQQMITLASSEPDLEVHGDVGIDLQARWIQPVIQHQAVGERFALVAVTVTGYTTDDDPEIP